MKKEIKRSYLKGIIGASIFGIIGCIPLMYMYIYKAKFLLVLTLLVPVFAIYGYYWCRGKISEKASYINYIITFLIILVAITVVVPILTLKQAEYPITLHTMRQLYEYNEFKIIIFRNFMLSELFALLGSVLISINLKYQLIDFKNRKNYKISLLEESNLEELKKEAARKLMPIFKKYNAINKENAITRDEVLAEVEDKNAAKYFSYLKEIKIIKKHKNKFYYVEEEMQNSRPVKKNFKSGLAISGSLLIGAIIIMFINVPIQESSIAWDENIKFEISKEWSVLEKYSKEKGWSFYQYISNEESAQKDEITSTVDYPAIIQLYYEVNKEEQTSVDEIKAQMETYFKEQLSPETYLLEDDTTTNGYEVVKSTVKFLTADDNIQTEFLYYVISGDKIAYVTAITYNQSESEILKQYIDEMTNTIHFEK